MTFICPQCKVGALRITASIELPPDSRSDEITLQIVNCACCKFNGIAVYEESRRGASDTFHHTGYGLSAQEIKSLHATIKQCPQPKNPDCTCTAHQKLGHKNSYGQWDLLDDMACQTTFVMYIA
ncbi:MAG: hypothetical protein JXA33_02340 [Anaerolineae bacterium]|nr:hypothetical protein [Anaerolineae bacterium]